MNGSMSVRIWAWMVTSSAVVGSSANSSAGLQDSALAIIARCRMASVEDGERSLAVVLAAEESAQRNMRIRLATLRERASRNAAAVSIEDGVLRAGTRLVVLPPIQARLATALLERMATPVFPIRSREMRHSCDGSVSASITGSTHRHPQAGAACAR